MPEPLILSDHMVGEWDPDLLGWAARDWTSGPAGVRAIVLPGGVELEVDIASPATFVGLWVEATKGDRPLDEAGHVLVAMLGEDRARRLLSMSGPHHVETLGAGAYDELERRRRLRSADGPTAAGGRPGRTAENGVLPALGRYALASDAADQPGASPLTQAIAHVDAALAAAGVHAAGGFAFDGRARMAAATAAGLLHELWRNTAPGPAFDVIDRHRVAGALERVSELVQGSPGRRLRRIANDLRGMARPARPAMAATSSSAPESTVSALVHRLQPVSRTIAVDTAALPASLAGLTVAARATTASEIEVRIHAGAAATDRCWARAFAPDGMVAAAPFRAGDVDGVARLLVPPRLLGSMGEPGLIEIDVTDRPGDPRQRPGFRSVVDAVHEGRSAARAERLDARRNATARWERCATAWDEVGDHERAAAARLHVGLDDRGRVPRALLADPLVEYESG